MLQILGVLLFLGGIYCGLWALGKPFIEILNALISLFEVLSSSKLYALIGAAILIWGGWKLVGADSKKRGKAQKEARYILENGYLYGYIYLDMDRIRATISTLERWDDNETKYLVGRLHEILKQKAPDGGTDKEPEETAVKSENLRPESLTIEDLEAKKVQYKDRPGLIKLIDEIIEARHKETKKTKG